MDCRCLALGFGMEECAVITRWSPKSSGNRARLYCLVRWSHHHSSKTIQDACTMAAVSAAEDKWPCRVSLPQLLSDLFIARLATLTGQFSASGRTHLAHEDSFRGRAQCMCMGRKITKPFPTHFSQVSSKGGIPVDSHLP